MIRTVSDLLYLARQERSREFVRWIIWREQRKTLWLTLAIFAVLGLGALVWILR